MSDSITYGIGGYDPDHPNGNVVERFVDNGDGTGTLTTYDADGEVVSTEQVTGLPAPAAPDPDPVDVLTERIAELEAVIDALIGEAP